MCSVNQLAVSAVSGEWHFFEGCLHWRISMRQASLLHFRTATRPSIVNSVISINNVTRAVHTLPSLTSPDGSSSSRRAMTTRSVIAGGETDQMNSNSCATDTQASGADIASMRSHYNEYASEPGDCGGEERTTAWGYNRRSLGPRFIGLPDSLLSVACGGGCPLSLGSQLPPNCTVVDLGCGAGIDVVTAAMVGGPTCKVIGVDLTEGMLLSARKNADECGVGDRVTLVQAGLEDSGPFFEDEKKELINEVEGEEQNEGVVLVRGMDRGVADIVISNGVINLLNKKARVFQRTFELLKPGGRLQLSDCVRDAEAERLIAQGDTEAVAVCVSA